MLADVIASGTATGARAAGFKLPAAGKTGTTDNYTDAWFVGYTPHLVAGVWFGLDKPAPIMNRGFAAVVAVPAWADFMKTGDRARCAGLVPAAGRCREGDHLPPQRHARDRCVPPQLDRRGLRAGGTPRSSRRAGRHERAGAGIDGRVERL